MKKVVLAAFLILALGGIAASALADPPVLLPQPERYMRLGASAYGHSHIVPTVSSAAGFVAQAASSSVAVNPNGYHLFKWGTVVTVSCPAQAVFCWTQARDATIDVTGQMTVPSGTSGVGPCFRVEAGLSMTDTVLADMFRPGAAAKVGQRAGFCSSAYSRTAGMPCRVNADCQSGSGGVCITSCYTGAGIFGPGAPTDCSDPNMLPFDNGKGAFLTSLAPVGTTCFVKEER